MFLVCDWWTLWADVDGAGCPVVIPCDGMKQNKLPFKKEKLVKQSSLITGSPTRGVCGCRSDLLEVVPSLGIFSTLQPVLGETFLSCAILQEPDYQLSGVSGLNMVT